MKIRVCAAYNFFLRLHCPLPRATTSPLHLVFHFAGGPVFGPSRKLRYYYRGTLNGDDLAHNISRECTYVIRTKAFASVLVFAFSGRLVFFTLTARPHVSCDLNAAVAHKLNRSPARRAIENHFLIIDGRFIANDIFARRQVRIVKVRGMRVLIVLGSLFA